MNPSAERTWSRDQWPDMSLPLREGAIDPFIMLIKAGN